jgi:hypothetical protein
MQPFSAFGAMQLYFKVAQCEVLKKWKIHNLDPYFLRIILLVKKQKVSY